MRLYDITEAYIQLQLRAEDGEDVAEELAELDGALQQKAEGVLHVLKNIEAGAHALDLEIQRLTERKRTAENNARRMRDYLHAGMEQAGIMRIQAGTFTITLRDGPERVDVDDESKLPDAYVRVKREPNKQALLANYRQTGEVVEGTHITRSTSLVIR